MGSIVVPAILRFSRVTVNNLYQINKSLNRLPHASYVFFLRRQHFGTITEEKKPDATDVPPISEATIEKELIKEQQEFIKMIKQLIKEQKEQKEQKELIKVQQQLIKRIKWQQELIKSIKDLQELIEKQNLQVYNIKLLKSFTRKHDEFTDEQ